MGSFGTLGVQSMMAGMSRWPKFEKDGCIASKLRNLGTVIVGAHLLLHLPSAVHIYGWGGHFS